MGIVPNGRGSGIRVIYAKLYGGAFVADFSILVRLTASNGEKWQSLGVFAILVRGIVLACGYRPFISLLLQGGRPGTFTILIACTVLVNVVLNSCLIPLMGVYGATVATPRFTYWKHMQSSSLSGN